MEKELDLSFLKNMPKGRELYCLNHGDVQFEEFIESGVACPVVTKCVHGVGSEVFRIDGKQHSLGECLLFPSRDCRDWDKWQEILVKKGDFVVDDATNIVCYVSDVTNHKFQLRGIKNILTVGLNTGVFNSWASSEQIEDFKKKLKSEGYEIKGYNVVKIEQPKKFDPAALQPFAKVLVRDGHNGVWQCDIFSSINDDSGTYVCVGGVFLCCIPYNEDTKHLRGSILRPPVSYDIF